MRQPIRPVPAVNIARLPTTNAHTANTAARELPLRVEGNSSIQDPNMGPVHGQEIIDLETMVDDIAVLPAVWDREAIKIENKPQIGPVSKPKPKPGSPDISYYIKIEKSHGPSTSAWGDCSLSEMTLDEVIHEVSLHASAKGENQPIAHITFKLESIKSDYAHSDTVYTIGKDNEDREDRFQKMKAKFKRQISMDLMTGVSKFEICVEPLFWVTKVQVEPEDAEEVECPDVKL